MKLKVDNSASVESIKSVRKHNFGRYKAGNAAGVVGNYIHQKRFATYGHNSNMEILRDAYTKDTRYALKESKIKTVVVVDLITI